MRLGLKNIFEESLKYVKLKKNDVVLDIGANDGTLLSYYKKKKLITIGCEPAKNLQKVLKQNCNFILNDFWSKKSLSKKLRCKFIVKKENWNLRGGPFGGTLFAWF